MSTDGALFRFSSSASMSTQQDKTTWSYKVMSKKQATDQINFLLKTLRDMVEKIADLESEKMALLKKLDKSENDMLVLNEVKEQLTKKEEFRAKYETELRELQEAIGSSTTAVTPKGFAGVEEGMKEGRKEGRNEGRKEGANATRPATRLQRRRAVAWRGRRRKIVVVSGG